MADVLLSTVDLDVFGGPTTVDVSVDFGQTGQRGSRIWSGSLTPELALVGQDIQLYDYYINTNTGQVYSYILEVGSPQWVPFFSLTLPQYSAIIPVEFVGGVTQIDLPLALVFSNFSGFSASDFVIRYNISHTNPTSSTFGSSIYVDSGTGAEYLRIQMSAVEFASGTWSGLASTIALHVFITYIGSGGQ